MWWSMQQLLWIFFHTNGSKFWIGYWYCATRHDFCFIVVLLLRKNFWQDGQHLLNTYWVGYRENSFLHKPHRWNGSRENTIHKVALILTFWCQIKLFKQNKTFQTKLKYGKTLRRVIFFASSAEMQNIS